VFKVEDLATSVPCDQGDFVGRVSKEGVCAEERQARGLVKIDVNKTSKVWDYFVSRGWLT
jgi:hypothetical protein